MPAIINKLCSAVSLDESELPTSLDATSRAEIREPDAKIQVSNGEEWSRKRDDEINVDEEAEGWIQEFGVGATETIRGFVLGAMDDYTYLRQYAIK